MYKQLCFNKLHNICSVFASKFSYLIKPLNDVADVGCQF